MRVYLWELQLGWGSSVMHHGSVAYLGRTLDCAEHRARARAPFMPELWLAPSEHLELLGHHDTRADARIALNSEYDMAGGGLVSALSRALPRALRIST